MKVEQISTGCLAQGAYYIESNGEAVIIDPLRETQPYLDKLAESGAKLKYIFETHFHADFVSGHLDLAKKTGATIVYGPMAQTSYDIHVAEDGEVLSLGNVKFKILHTPGHTMESTTFLLLDENDKEYAIFTGDTLFLGDVGRPDLAIKQGEVTKEDLARMLFFSLRNKIMPLPDDVIVYPAHGAGSACGKNMSKETWGYLGEQKQTNYALREDMTKEEFIVEVTAGLMPPPQYFSKNAMLNKGGYDSVDNAFEKGMNPLSPEQFEAMAEQEEALILDVRSEGEFAKAHSPGSIFIGLEGSFAPWVGALIPDLKQPILLVAPAGKEKEAVTRLARVGYDNAIGFLNGGIAEWKNSNREADRIKSISAEKFAERMNAGKVEQVLDVRKPTEYLAQHVEGAVNFPLDFINRNMSKLNRNDTYYLHCLGGYRSMIAASILKARGFQNLVDITGGWRAIEAAGASVTEFACPTSISQEVLDAAVEELI